MAHFAPHLIRSRRRRMMAAQRASCGIALASFRLNAEGGASDEMLLLPVSAAYVADVLESNTLHNLSEADKRFINRLALSRDARLRTVAAAVEGALDPETVRKRCAGSFRATTTPSGSSLRRNACSLRKTTPRSW